MVLYEFVFSPEGGLGIFFKWLLADCDVCACWGGIDYVGKPAVMGTPADESLMKANVLLMFYAA